MLTKVRILFCAKIYMFCIFFWGGANDDTLQGTNISPKNGSLKMIFLFPRWDMLISWRVSFCVEGNWEMNGNDDSCIGFGK